MLAKELGYYDPYQMLDGTDPGLLYEWFAYYQQQPFGETRDDIRAALISSTVANFLGKKPGGGKFDISDFMLDFSKSQKRKGMDPLLAQQVLRKRYGNNRKSSSKPDSKN